MARHLTKQEILTIPQMVRDGKSNPQIAATLKTSVPTISRWLAKLKKAGHEWPHRKGGSRKIELSAEQK